MSLSVRFTPEEEALLEAASRQSTRSKGELVRQGVRELCQRLLEQDGQTPYELGQDLFGAGHLAEAPTDPAKRRVWEALRAKHGRLERSLEFSPNSLQRSGGHPGVARPRECCRHPD